MSIIEEIYKAIIEVGGTPYRVGGSVRDQFLGHTPKDIDTEVYGIAQEQLMAVLRQFGRVDATGVKFEVIKLWVDGKDYDFSMPRRDSKNGRGYKGFMVEADPTMTVAEAAWRRDYTINAISIAPDGTVVDPYNGVEDLKAGILRHTSAAFAEDPLRVLRGMQFCARMELTVTRETAAMCFSIRDEYNEIVKERVWGEWYKWATKGITPSMGIKFLVSTGWVYLYPELSDLIGVKQDPIWHKEGSAFVHTEHTCDAAAAIARREGLNEEDTAILVFGALCHDYGKATTSKRSEASGRWIAPGHPEAGFEPAIAFMRSIKAPEHIVQAVAELTLYHMRHLHGNPGRNTKAARRLAGKMTISPYMLGLIMEADQSGRPWTGEFMTNPDAVDFIAGMTEAKAQIKPLFQGRDLIAMGMKPGVGMGVILKAIAEAQVEGNVTTFAEAQAMAAGMIGG